MKVLFIGGTGVISSACAELALTRGIELYLLNRGESARPVPVGAQVLRADIRDRAQTQAALAGLTFGAVVDWVAFTPEHIAVHQLGDGLRKAAEPPAHHRVHAPEQPLLAVRRAQNRL
jgi:nucleoside-diphosphate-sugar epimerase